MCEPVTISMGVIAAASAATAIIGQQQQKKAAKGFENQKKQATDFQISETRKRATDDYLNQVRVEQNQQRQEQEAVVEKSGDVAKQGNAAVATAQASAAERGIGGGRSVDQVLADYRLQQDVEVGRLERNQGMKDQQHVENLRGFDTQYNNRASSITPYQEKPVAPVDYFGPIFGAAATTLSTGAATGAFKADAPAAAAAPK